MFEARVHLVRSQNAEFTAGQFSVLHKFSHLDAFVLIDQMECRGLKEQPPVVRDAELGAQRLSRIDYNRSHVSDVVPIESLVEDEVLSLLSFRLLYLWLFFTFIFGPFIKNGLAVVEVKLILE